MPQAFFSFCVASLALVQSVGLGKEGVVGEPGSCCLDVKPTTLQGLKMVKLTQLSAAPET